LSDIAPTGAQRHSFDYYFVAKPGQLSIDHCTKIFVENIDDLYLYCTSYDKVSLLSQTEDITTLDEVPELSTDNIISTIVRHHLPLTHDDMVGAYVRLLTPNIDKQNDDIKEVDLSSTTTDEEPLDQHILKYCSEPLAHLLKSYGRGNSVYVNTSHHGISNKDGFFELKARFDLKFAFYIHDLIPIEYPEYVRAASYADHEKRMDAVSFVADLVIVNSEASKQSFWSWCDEHKVTKPACEVAYIGVEEQFLEYQADHFSSVLQNALDGDYFVYIGTIEPRKNHLLLLQIWREWVKAGITPPKLVIIGKRGWENQNVFNFLDQCHAIKPYVAELSNLSDASLKKFIKGAAALLFPSFIEGWGMPLVEAQAMGTPVLCSDIPVFHEASAEKATFIDPLDALTWQKTILDFCDPAKDVRYKAKEKLKDYSPPNWEEHFSKVLPLLNSMLQKDARENYPEMT
jgi:glycosyltransferase involved in cell wall biosynthesis